MTHTGCRIVVARDQHKPGQVSEAVQLPVQHAYRTDRRQGPVVNIAGHDQDVDFASFDFTGEPVKEMLMQAGQVATVELAAEMPVGGVEYADGRFIHVV